MAAIPQVPNTYRCVDEQECEAWGYRTFGVSFGAVFCCVGAVVRVLKLGWPGFMGGQKVCLGSGFFVVVPRDKSV